MLIPEEGSGSDDVVHIVGDGSECNGDGDVQKCCWIRRARGAKITTNTTLGFPIIIIVS